MRGVRGAGLYKLTSRIFTDNGASRAVHLAAGFEEVGVQRRHGRLDGAWKDCVLVERLLGPAAAQDSANCGWVGRRVRPRREVEGFVDFGALYAPK